MPFVILFLSMIQAMTLAASGDEVAQEAAAECFCSAASSDGGRALLGPVVESGVIFALMESKSQAARSAAARRVDLLRRVLNFDCSYCLRRKLYSGRNQECGWCTVV